MKKMKKIRALKNVNGKMRWDEIEPTPELLTDAERVPIVMEQLARVVYPEAPTVSVDALLSVTAGVLAFGAGDPVKAAQQAGEALQVMVNEHVARRAPDYDMRH